MMGVTPALLGCMEQSPSSWSRWSGFTERMDVQGGKAAQAACKLQ